MRRTAFRIVLTAFAVCLASIPARADGVVSAGATHMLAVQNGLICSSGLNSDGQLGTGNYIRRPAPAPAAYISSAVYVSTGDRHSLAVTRDGVVLAWGNNSYGRLGDGTTTRRATPQVVPSLNQVVAVAAGQYHSLALKSDGTVWGWGYNGDGQVGDGTYKTQVSPVSVVGLSDVIAIAAGAEFSVALRRDGTVWAWGKNSSGQLGIESMTGQASPVQVSGLTDAKAIGAGSTHAMAVRTADGSVWSWGSGSYGQIGNGVNREQTKPTRSGTVIGIKAVAGGLNFTLALHEDGTLYSWGRNEAGQLGDRTQTLQNSPVRVRDVAGAVAIAAGTQYGIARTASGVVSWGNNENGQFGNGASGTSSLVPIAARGCQDTQAVDPSSFSTRTRFTGSGEHLLFVQADRACAIGDNGYGQLGDGAIVDRWRPKFSAGPRDIIQVATGRQHSLGVTSDGSVWAWGANSYGRLGDGTTTPRIRPFRLQSMTKAVAVGAGAYHSVALLSDGTVVSWGYNGDGQLGDGTVNTRYEPVRVIGLSDVVAIAVGDEFSAALRRDGTVWAWGKNSSGQLGDRSTDSRTSPVEVSELKGIVAIASGTTHMLALRGRDGTIWTWGNGTYGQLGTGDGGSESSPVRAGDLAGAISIAGGEVFSLAVLADGTVWSWGRNTSGQLGDRTVTSKTEPVRVTAADKGRKVAAGGAFSILEKSDGTNWIWGDNSSGQFGTGTTTGSTTMLSLANCVDEAAIPPRSRFTSKVLDANADHSMVVRADASLWVSGTNQYGQLGTGNVLPATPGRAVGVANTKSVATGAQHSVAVTNDGSVWAWGTGSYGRLGDGTTVAKQTPVRLTGISGVTTVAAGAYHSMALKSDGTVWCWGYNGNGQLGNGSTTDRATPTQVSTLSNVVAIAAGDEHSLALKADGTVWAWGTNGSGQLGNGTGTGSSSPVQATNLPPVFAIAAGARHTVAILAADGSVWSWGSGAYGQLGDGGTSDRYNLVRAGDLTGVVDIAAGPTFTLAVSHDGTVWAWGDNRAGQFGNRTTDSRSVPVKTDVLTNAVAVAAGTGHSLALTNDGRLFGWGSNAGGQYAPVGTPPSSTIPIEVGSGFAACNCLVDLTPSLLPKLSRIAPNSALAGSADTEVRVYGEDFQATSAVQWNQASIATRFVSDKELRIILSRQILSQPGTATITVVNGTNRSGGTGFLVSTPPTPKGEVRAAAVIEPKQMSFPAPTGSIINGTQESLFWIRNNGDQAFPYRIEVKKGEAWLSLSTSPSVMVNRVEGNVQPQSAVGVTVRTTFNRLSVPNEDGVIAIAYGPSMQAESEINVRASSLDKPEILLSRSKIKILATKADLDSSRVAQVPFQILNLGTNALHWEAITSAGWLTVSPRLSPSVDGLAPVTGSSGAFPVQSVNLQLDFTTLKRMEITADNPVGKSAQATIVVRDLGRADVPARRLEVDVEITDRIEAMVEPTGFLFTGELTESLAAKELQVMSLSGRNLEFQLQPSVLWNTLFGQPCAEPCVNQLASRAIKPFSFRPVTLPPDHREVITPTAANLSVTFNVRGDTSVSPARGGNWLIEGMVVRRGAARASSSGSKAGGREAATGCAATLHIVPTGLPNRFSAPRTVIQHLAFKIADGCGAWVDKGTVMVVPSNGDPSIRLRPTGEGSWEGNWQPARTAEGSSVSLEVVVYSHAGAEGRRTIQGTVTAGSAGQFAPTTPIIVNGASFRDQNVISPGTTISIFGTDLLNRDGLVRPTGDTLPTELAGASVLVDGIKIPLLFAVRSAVGAGGIPFDQINAVVPYDLQAGRAHLVSVERAGMRSGSAEVHSVRSRPAFFLTGGTYPFAIALDQEYALVNESNRATRGKYVQFYATGLGAVTSPPAAERPAGFEPLSRVAGPVRVWFGTVAAVPAFAGLAPGFSGLYQINVEVPDGVKAENGFVDVTLEVDGTRGVAVPFPVIP